MKGYLKLLNEIQMMEIINNHQKILKLIMEDKILRRLNNKKDNL